MVVQRPGCTSGFWKLLPHADIKFDVWALSCIGAWVGIVYNQFDDDKKVENNDRAEQTYQFFKNGVFRDDESYEHFPINTVFGPDWRSNIKALNKFVTDPDNYKDFVWDPYRMMDSFQESMSTSVQSHEGIDGQEKIQEMDEGDINGWILNQAMAPNPFVRYLTSMMYLSNVTGLSKDQLSGQRIYEDANQTVRERLNQAKEKKPLIFHNAWNLDKQELALFSNRESNGR